MAVQKSLKEPEGKGPSREDLLQLYKISIDEYRFQVQLNWQRAQYYFVLNAALIAAGGGLIGVQGDKARPLAAIPFSVGLIAVVLSILVNITQHNYYRSAREHLKILEQRLGLGDLGIRTTLSLGGRYRRPATVKTFNNVMFGMLGIIDLAGVLYTSRSFLRALRYVASSWFN